MPRARPSAWIVAPAALSLIYALAVVIAAWRAPEKGFQAFTGRRVIHVAADGVADRAGLREGDVIVAIDGDSITGTIDYAYRVLVRAPGERLVLGIERDGERRDITLELAPASPPWSAIVATLLATGLLGLGLVARIGRAGDPVARAFYRTTIIYTVAYVGALSWPRLIVHPVLGCLFLAAMFAGPKIALDLAVDFPHRTTGDNAFARRCRQAATMIALLLGAAAAASLAVAIADYASGGGDRGLSGIVACVAIQCALLPIYSAIGVTLQLRAHRNAQGALRAQLRWLVFGQVLGGLPVLAAIPVASRDLDRFLIAGYQPFVVAVAALWFVTYGFAVLRIRIADVDALIKSSLGYALTTGAAITVYAAIVLGAGWLTGRLVGDAGPWPYLVAGLVAAMLFGPLRARVDGWIDRRFFRDRRHYVEALRAAGESLAVLREPADVAREAVTRIVEAVRAESGALYMREGEQWCVVHAVGDAGAASQPGASSPVASQPAASQPAASQPAASQPAASQPAASQPAASQPGASSPAASQPGALPDAPADGVALAVGDAAALVLGPRRSGDLYSSHDRDLLGALASQLAIALANAHSFGTIADLSRTLETQNLEIRELRDRLEDENRFLRARVHAATDGATLVGDSRPIRELQWTVDRVARSDSNVLVLGESGTGKGLLARIIHASSPRAAGPFLHVDCGAIAAGVFESELFGHERGAFTGAARLRRGPIELADGGTLFLDEIGDLPLDLQPKLLRVLEDRAVVRVGATAPVAVDVRIVGATHRPLDEMVARGTFREDLYFRLRVVEIVVPPLRVRRADIPALCASLLPRVARRCGQPARPLTDEALSRLVDYSWPGNVRELENILERALVLGDGDAIDADDIELSDRAPPPPPDEEPAEQHLPHDAVMEDIERRRLTAALRDAAGNQSHAAKALGMPRTTFINKLRRHGLL